MPGRNSLIVRIVVKGSPFKIVEDGSGFKKSGTSNGVKMISALRRSVQSGERFMLGSPSVVELRVSVERRSGGTPPPASSTTPWPAASTTSRTESIPAPRWASVTGTLLHCDRMLH